MFRYLHMLPVLALVGALGFFWAPNAVAQTAKKLNCKGCVKSKQLKNAGIKGKDLKDSTVTRAKIADSAVTPEKLGYRAFDATGQAIGPVGFDGRVLFEVEGGEHDGKQVTAFVHQQSFSGAPLIRFRASQVSYTMANCTGQAWLNHDDVLPENYALVSLAAVGPHPDFGADGSGNPIRLALLVPDTPNAVILPDVQDASYSEYDRETGTIKCIDISRGSDPGVLFDTIENPNLSDFVPPFRVGIE